MRTSEITEYIHADFLVAGNPKTEISDIFNDNNPDTLFERFEDRLIWHLLKTTALDLSVDGRSHQVIDELFWDEYHNGNDSDKARIQKQVKTALHNLYKARFIKRDRDGNVFLGSNIHVHRIYGHLPDYMQIVITSHYVEDEDCKIYEHHMLYTDEKQNSYGDDLAFVSARKLGPISRAMVVAHRMGDMCTPSDFHDESIYQLLKEAGWLTEYNGKVSVIGDFKVVESTEDDKYYLEYVLSDSALNDED